MGSSTTDHAARRDALQHLTWAELVDRLLQTEDQCRAKDEALLRAVRDLSPYRPISVTTRGAEPSPRDTTDRLGRLLLAEDLAIAAGVPEDQRPMAKAHRPVLLRR